MFGELLITLSIWKWVVLMMCFVGFLGTKRWPVTSIIKFLVSSTALDSKSQGKFFLKTKSFNYSITLLFSGSNSNEFGVEGVKKQDTIRGKASKQGIVEGFKLFV